jgi:hypothetical protein
MKITANRIRRRRKASADGSFFKKESQDPSFFTDAPVQPFFQAAPNVLQSKCAECEDEQKSVGHAAVTSEEVPEEMTVPSAEPSKEGETVEEEPPCTAGSVNLGADTVADYHQGAGVLVGEKKIPSKNCPDCEDDCVDGSGMLSVAFTVDTTVNLPTVPENLTPCQQARVKAAIEGPLTAHEQQHVRAFKKFEGTANLPIRYHGCGAGYDDYLAGLAKAEFERRRKSADTKSAALDPFSVPVDLCCKEPKPAKK